MAIFVIVVAFGMMLVGFAVGRAYEFFMKPVTRDISVQVSIREVDVEELTIYAIRARLAALSMPTSGSKEQLAEMLRKVDFGVRRAARTSSQS